MKIAEETGDGDLKEQAKVNFGMANASMKWTNHVNNILHGLQNGDQDGGALQEEEEEQEEDEDQGGLKLP